jgi:hypothetical protein
MRPLRVLISSMGMGCMCSVACHVEAAYTPHPTSSSLQPPAPQAVRSLRTARQEQGSIGARDNSLYQHSTASAGSSHRAWPASTASPTAQSAGSTSSTAQSAAPGAAEAAEPARAPGAAEAAEAAEAAGDVASSAPRGSSQRRLKSKAGAVVPLQPCQVHRQLPVLPPPPRPRPALSPPCCRMQRLATSGSNLTTTSPRYSSALVTSDAAARLLLSTVAAPMLVRALTQFGGFGSRMGTCLLHIPSFWHVQPRQAEHSMSCCTIQALHGTNPYIASFTDASTHTLQVSAAAGPPPSARRSRPTTVQLDAAPPKAAAQSSRRPVQYYAAIALPK